MTQAETRYGEAVASDAGGTSRLIGSDRVEGTEVRRPAGDHIGRIERVMIDKVSGKAAYAVMSFGGFLGFGENYYPVPWSLLKYNTALDAYELDITEDQLRNAPAHEMETDWRDRNWENRLHDYYQVPPYWGY